MIDAGNNGKPAISPNDAMKLQGAVFDIASGVHKGVFFTAMQKVGALLATGVPLKDVDVQVKAEVIVKRKSLIQLAQPQIPPDMKRM